MTQKIFDFFRLKYILPILIIVSVTFGFNTLEIGQIGTIFVIPLSFVYFFKGNFSRLNYVINIKPAFWYILLFIFSTISILYSIDVNIAISTQAKMFIVLLFTLGVFSFSISSLISIKIVYISNVIVLFLLFIYVFTVGNIDLNNAERIDESYLNANAYGYYIFNGLSALFLLYTSRNGYLQKSIYSILIAVGCSLSIYLIIASASRGAFFVLIFLIIGNIFIITSVSKKTFLPRLLFLVILMFGFFYLTDFINKRFLQNSYLVERYDDLKYRETPREFHIKKAIEIGIDNPVIGVGAGNYAIIPKEIEPGSFSHNTFTEVFANFGIIGLIIYLKMLLILTFKILENFRTKNIKIRIINYQFLLFFLGFLIYNTLYVVYLSTIFMHFLFVIYAHIVYIDRQIKLQQN